MRTLYIIPARGGSKRIVNKNIKLLNGIPLIHYTINTARQVADDRDICVTTDDPEIIKVVQATGLQVPFIRPEELSTDHAGSREVILHALDRYRSAGQEYDAVMLLQPTSPFRLPVHLHQVQSIFEESGTVDMVVSVGETKHNPYFSLFEEDGRGFLKRSKEGEFFRSQDTPKVYYYNGSIYLINTQSILKYPTHKMPLIKKYLMDEMYSIDIDTPLDWLLCDCIVKNGMSYG